jgi:hypothetical protein
MTEFLSRFDNHELMGLIALVGAFSCGIVAIAGGLWLEIRKTEVMGSLKRDMLERGMSAHEIQAVLDAGTYKSKKLSSNVPVG